MDIYVFFFFFFQRALIIFSKQIQFFQEILHFYFMQKIVYIVFIIFFDYNIYF